MMRLLGSRLLGRAKRVGWSEVVFLSSALAIGGCGWCFLEVAGAVAVGNRQELEERMLLAFRQPSNLLLPVGPPWLAEMGRDVSALGGATVVILLSLFVLGHLGLRREWQQAVLVSLSITGGYALSTLLKAGYGRERPEVVPHLSMVSSASFPSGHSLSASVVYLTIGTLLAQRAARRREKIYIMAMAFLLTFSIGISRVFLGVHYPSDVIAGWNVGIGWALACWLASRWVWRKSGSPAGASGSAGRPIVH